MDERELVEILARLRDKAKDRIKRNGKDIAKELLLKLNNTLAGTVGGRLP